MDLASHTSDLFDESVAPSSTDQEQEDQNIETENQEDEEECLKEVTLDRTLNSEGGDEDAREVKDQLDEADGENDNSKSEMDLNDSSDLIAPPSLSRGRSLSRVEAGMTLDFEAPSETSASQQNMTTSLEDNHPTAPETETNSEQDINMILQQTAPPVEVLQADLTLPSKSGKIKFESLDEDQKERLKKLHRVFPASTGVKALLMKISTSELTVQQATLDYPQPYISPNLTIRDSLANLANQFAMDTSRRQPSISENQIEDSNALSALRTLIAEGSYRTALAATTRILTMKGFTRSTIDDSTTFAAVYTIQSMQIWLFRIISLSRLGLNDQALQELDTFGTFDRPDLFTKPTQKVTSLDDIPCYSIVPFGLRLIQAQLPGLLGRCSESLDRLYQLKALCSRVLKNLNDGLDELGRDIELEDLESVQNLWLNRLDHITIAICFNLYKLDDYENLTHVIREIQSSGRFLEGHILASLVRIYLAMGDIESGSLVAGSLAEQFGEDSSHYLEIKALIAVAHGKFSDAKSLFAQLHEREPESLTYVNNLAVTELYSGHLQQAILTFEEGIEPLPRLHGQPVFNLATLYELESNKHQVKKKVLLSSVLQKAGDSVDSKMLKLSAS